MTHITDIDDALDDRDLPAIRAAFRDLVLWQHVDAVVGAEDPGDLACLLDRVTAALEADKIPMPGDLVDGITQGTGEGSWMRDDRSYAAGARAVAATSLRWQALFNTRLGFDD